MKWTIGKKLAVSFGAIVVMTLGFAVFILTQLFGLRTLHHESTLRAENAMLVDKVAVIPYKAYSIMTEAFTSDNLDAVRTQWETTREEAHGDFSRVMEICSTEEELQAAQSASHAFDEIDEHFETEMLPLLEESQGLCSEVCAVAGEINDHRREIVEAMELLTEHIEAESLEADAAYNAVATRVTLITIILAGLGLAASVLITWFMTRNIATPMGLITRGAACLAGGDASLSGMEEDPFIKINARSDELGDIGKEFSKLIEFFQQKATVVDSIAKGELDIDIHLSSEADVIGESLVRVRQSLQGLTAEIRQLANDAVRGRLDKRGDLDKFDGEYETIVSGVNEVIDTLVGHLDSVPTPVMIIDREFNVMYLNKAGGQVCGKDVKKLVGTKCHDNFKTEDCNTGNCACHRTMSSGKVENSETIARPTKDLTLDISYTGIALRDREGEVIGALEVVSDQTAVKNAQRKTAKIADYQAAEVDKLQGVLSKMADGDLTVSYDIAEADEDTKETYESFSGIGAGLNRTLDGLNDILGQVLVAVDQVNSGATQVSSAAQSLSQGATEQASSLEEVSSSMTQVGGQTKQNADNASQANQLAGSARDSADQGNHRMAQMLAAMEDITNKSAQVQKIIKVIDEIAFQTNLLALNAAVEAARAGVHGKGFAVVAEEVRNLAQRSAKAANETTELIESNVASVNQGSAIAEETAKSLNEIVEGIAKATDLVNEIAAASKEQTNAVDEITEAISQIDQVTQANTANAEESAAAAEELSGQSSQLQQMIERFRLRDTEIAPRSLKPQKSPSRYSFDEESSEAEEDAEPRMQRNGGSRQHHQIEGPFEVMPDDLIRLDDEEFEKF
jgi:methyl-accepting chemotaxis protein